MAVNFNHISNAITAVGGTGLLQDIGAGGATYQLFTSSSTWTKPTAAVGVYVECVGGGGGGGSGSYVDTTTHPNHNGTGGAGGQGGVFISRFFLASSLTSTVTVTIGAGGAGGAGNPFVTSDGILGFDGGLSSFGSYVTTPQARGGAGGVQAAVGPTTSVNNSYYGNRVPMIEGLYSGLGGPGQQNLYTSTSSNNGQIGALGPGGGGPGGGVNTLGGFGAFYFGFDGGYGFAERQGDILNSIFGSSQSTGGGGRGGNLGGGNGEAGNAGSSLGAGGGGGNGATNTNNGPGGNGGFPGGGGGGSGACTVLGAAFNPGGTGGNGYVLVVTW